MIELELDGMRNRRSDCFTVSHFLLKKTHFLFQSIDSGQNEVGPPVFGRLRLRRDVSVLLFFAFFSFSSFLFDFRFSLRLLVLGAHPLTQQTKKLTPKLHIKRMSERGTATHSETAPFLFFFLLLLLLLLVFFFSLPNLNEFFPTLYSWSGSARESR